MSGEAPPSAAVIADHRANARTAALSMTSNALLIVVKVIAGTLTGSIAILTEAAHSSVDLVASTVAFLSVRKAGEPADESHRYGHDKIENLSAALEGVLILVGAAVIAFEAIRRLLEHGHVTNVGLGIVVIAVSMVVNAVISTRLARTAHATGSAALEGDATHLRTDAFTSAAVLGGLVLLKLTGAQWLDSAVALLVATVVVVPGVRLLLRSSQVLVDQSLPPEEVELVRTAIADSHAQGVVGYHELRTRRGGSRRYIDLHVQFRTGTSLESAHRTAHELQDEIRRRLAGADVLIHLEPEDRLRPGQHPLGGAGSPHDDAAAGGGIAGGGAASEG